MWRVATSCYTTAQRTLPGRGVRTPKRRRHAALGCWVLFSPLACYSELPRITLPRLYEKSSNTGETPRHEANHGSVHQRLATRTQPLVIFAHPPLLVDPCQCPLHHPSPRQHHEAFGGNSLRQSTLTPSLAHSLAHAISTFSGAGFFGRSTRSTLQPRVFSTQSAPLSSPR
jgi:hypothetical protein